MAEQDDNQKAPVTGEQGERVRYALQMTHELLVCVCRIALSSREDRRDQFVAMMAAEHLAKMAHRYLDVGYQILYDEPGFGTFDEEFAFFSTGFRHKT